MAERSTDRRGRGGRLLGAARTAAEPVGWVVVLTVVWAATLTSVGPLELAVAAVLAVPLAVLATATRRVLDAPARLPAGWWRWAVRLPVAVLTDTGRLAVATARAVRTGTPLGHERTLALHDPPPTGSDGRTAVGAVAISATPAAYVADVRPDALVLHALSDTPSTLEREVIR